MLAILDKYIIKKYLSTFGFIILIFSLIAIIIDFSEKVEDFIDKKPSTYEIIVHYYLNFIPYINSLLVPLYALIAVIFFTSRLAYNSEVISVLNAGVPFSRFLRPYVISASIIGIILLIGNHFLIPISNKIRLNFEHTFVYLNADKAKNENIHLFLDPNTKAYIKYYRKRDTTARDIRIEQFKNNDLSSILEAESAEWMNKTNHWKLSNYKIHTFDGIHETMIDGAGKSLDTTFNLRPEDFVRYLNQKEMLTSSQLSNFIEREKSRGIGNTNVYQIELYRRSADAFSILILTIIGAAVAARKVRGGIGLHLALGMGIGAMFIFLSKVSATFSMNTDFPPIFGVWIPNIIFSFIAWYLYRTAQK